MHLGSWLIGFLCAAALGLWWTRRIIRSLRRLTQAAQAYARGELTQAVPPVPVREVNALARSLGAMAEALRSRIGELTVQRNQATAILESMAEGVVALDPQGRIVLMNPAAAVLLGTARDRAMGRHAEEVMRHPDMQELVRAALQQHRRSMKDILLFQPKERILRLHGVPCQAGGPLLRRQRPPADVLVAGGLEGPSAVLVIQDVTESHWYEQLRKEFVANVSHELKSPLTAIRSLTETLLTGGALEDQSKNRQFVGMIDEEAARLSRLIEDLLALSQIESKAMPLKLALVELRPLAESVVASLKPSITSRGIAVTLEFPDGFAVRADPDRLQQVLFNLADNAIKYNTTGGRVTLSAASTGPWATVTVADTGIGIPDQDVPRLFERFYRVDKARSRELGGTGLGLSIVKHIVEAHGGTVSVESRVNQGSRFSFTIPLAS